METYQIIAESTEGFYKEKGSKFIGRSYHVESVDQVKAHIENLKKEYYDARHHCFAYVIEGEQHQLIRANDDGEPNHSAGDPILGQIKSFELTNTLVVVVRYFGGTKLGVSGLIHAYKTAAEEALAKAKIIKVEIKQAFVLEYGYEVTSETMRIVNDFGVEIINQEYLSSCTLTAKIEPEKFEALKAKLALLHLVVKKA